MTQYKLYILMRADLPSLNPGKAMAQAAHAANCLVGEWGYTRNVTDWKKEGKYFGTTIVLAVDKDTIRKILIKSAQLSIPHGPVHDETYPFNTTTEIAALIPKSKFTSPPILKEDNRVVLFRKELTCAYVLVADGSPEQAELVGGLPLYS